MSTEPAGPRADRRRAVRFHRLTLVLVVVLSVAATGLGVLNASQGPRLDSAEVNARAAIDRPGQRLVLHANQPVDAVTADQVTVTPETPTSVTVDGASITIRFTAALDYNTRYSVRVDGVRGASTGVTADLVHAFTTPDVTLYTLQRRGDDVAGDDQADQVLRHTLSGSASNEEVFSAPRIQEFASLDDAVAVVTLDETNVPALQVRWFDGTEYPVDIARPQVIRDLRASDSGTLFGYVVTSGTDAENPDHDSSLFVYDLADDSGIPREITGFDGRPLAVDSWSFVPNSSSVVVHGADEQLYLVDPLAEGDPVPLGTHDEQRGFVPGTVKLVVADPDRGSLIDLVDGTTTTLDLPEPTVDPALYATKLVVLDTDSYLQLFTEVTYSDAGSTVNSVIYRTGPEGSTEVYRTLTGTSRVLDYCVSPTGTFLVVEVAPNTSRADGYATAIGYEGTDTTFVRLADGEPVRGVSGAMLDWCR